VSGINTGEGTSGPLVAARKQQSRNVRFWHKADIQVVLPNVCFWG